MPRINNEPKRPWKSDRQPRQDKRADPFYTSTAWRKLRNQYIATQPICEHCKQAGNYKAAKVVDHIAPRKQRPELELDWDNLQSLCQRCHQQKTAKEKSG
jgi:5-methylcytosine-specific restriction protein A